MNSELRFIYVCSPYRGNLTEILQNTKKAQKYCEQVIKEGAVPIAPHLIKINWSFYTGKR